MRLALRRRSLMEITTSTWVILRRNNSTRIVEVDPIWQYSVRYGIGELQYRSFRMQDLYTSLTGWFMAQPAP